MNIYIRNRQSIGEGFCPSPNSLLISFTEPDLEFPTPSEEYVAVLQIKFNDIDRVVPGLQAFRYEDAVEVVEFVRIHMGVGGGNHSAITDIVVNCDAGLSRSAGAVAALTLWLNGKDAEKEIFRIRPSLNRRVYRSIVRATENLSFITGVLRNFK